MNEIISEIRNQREYREIINTLTAIDVKRLPLLITGLAEGAREAFYAAFVNNRKCKSRPVIAVLPQEKEISRLATALSQFGLRVAVYPLRDFTIRNIAASHEYEHERLSALYSIITGECDIVLTVPDAAIQYTMPRAVLEERVFTVNADECYNIDDICRILVECGYVNVDMVESSGQFSRRGGILDIYTSSLPFPVRIEFFGDEIDRMSYFDIMSQRRTEDIREVKIIPVRELIMRRGQAEKLSDIIRHSALKASDSHVKDELMTEAEALDNGSELKSIDKYISFVYPEKECLLDYTDPDDTIIFQEFGALIQRIRGYDWQESENDKSAVLSGIANGKYIEHTLGANAFEDIMRSRANLIINTFTASLAGMELSGIFTFITKQTLSFSDNFNLLVEELESYRRASYKIILFCEGEQNCRNIQSALNEKEFATTLTGSCSQSVIKLIAAPELHGFELSKAKFVCLSVCRGSQSVQKKKSGLIGRTKKKDAAERIMSYTDIQPGDYVVHSVHGIGVYIGLDSLLVAGVRRDFVKIKYADDDMLYLPCNQLDNLSKYIGAAENASVKLSRMGSADWGKSKTKVKAAAKEMAKELIQLYAERMRKQGFAFSPDDAIDKEFADTFEYDETQGQLDAIEDIKRDMEAVQPMDRLLCGDVGYGKTEVALRAAFKAVSNSKQVAILVPTTILALQHYQTMLSRMRGFPVKVDMISRFRTTKQQATTISEIERGETDIVVGTHRLLSKDVKFRDLGLVVIDEEQRFGVAQKEKLKKLVKNIDVLTLTATPIPRTLNMAMSGIRDMSILEEAPGDRLPVQSYVCEYDDGIINEAIKKELRRGGQIFYLCNTIEKMGRIAGKLSEANPEARIAVANGQMDKEELSDIWHRMVLGDIDILVCTTIIETGIDVPNANTLIIESADKMGLSQLHQLRGRVGRSSRRAYAYFTYPAGRVLTEISEKRLDAIRNFTEFGAGFKIAMRDLEIRGAGDLLGTEQHGNITDVGYELYMKLLNEAILEEKGESVKVRTECAVDFNIDAYIPEVYITNSNNRIEAYKKISLIRSEEDMVEVTDELLDRYGELPKCVVNLTKISLIRSFGSEAKLTKVDFKNGAVGFYSALLDVAGWNEVKKTFGDRLTVLNGGKPVVNCRVLRSERIFELTVKLLSAYLAVIKKMSGAATGSV